MSAVVEYAVLGWRVFVGARSQRAYCPEHGPSVPMLDCPIEHVRAEFADGACSACGATPTDTPQPVDPVDMAVDESLIAKWLNASRAARSMEHHFPADCLSEAADTYRHMCEEVDQARTEVARLRADITFLQGQWEDACVEERRLTVERDAGRAQLARLHAFVDGVRGLRDEWSVADASMRLHAPGVPSIALRDTAGRLTALLATIDKEKTDD